MSYILDALRKSERQRPPGPVPDLFSIQGPEPPQSRRLLAKGLAVALMAGCAVVLAVWASFEKGGSRGDALQAAARSPGLAAQAPAPEPEPPPETEPAPEPLPAPAPALAPGPASAPEPAPAPLPEPTPGPAALPAEPPPAATPSPMPPAVPSTPAPPPAMMPESAPASGTPPLPESPAVQPPLPDTAAGESPAPTAPATTAPAAPVDVPDPVPSDDRIVEFAELPPAIRQKLPELVISGHVWSDDPALRLLTLKDRVVREGAEAAPGVHLEQITQSGAVFVFRGWRFRMAGY